MFQKWDIIYTSRFPESVQCKKCEHYFSISKHACQSCGMENNVSSIVAKIRPIVLWLDQKNWFKSMAFAIPVSTTDVLQQDAFNHVVKLENYSFTHSDKKYHQPMRAIVHQATRIDGNVLDTNKLIGKITDVITQQQIEEKLLNWIFP